MEKAQEMISGLIAGASMPGQQERGEEKTLRERIDDGAW
jgi:hypothetical protein